MKPTLFISRYASPFAALTLAVAALVAGSPPAGAGLFKASPSKDASPFLENPQAMTRDPQLPFNKFGRNPSPRAWNRVRSFDQIAILPVNTTYLRPKNGSPSAVGERVRNEQAYDAEKMAQYMQTSFQRAFSRGGTYHVVSGPGRRTLTLELALVELRPSNIPINAVSTAAGGIIPGANFVGQSFSKGGIAMEGKLRNGETGELLAEFSDREQDKTTLFSFRDFSQYAHGRRTVDDWAGQVEKLSRTRQTQKIAGASAVTLNPF